MARETESLEAALERAARNYLASGKSIGEAIHLIHRAADQLNPVANVEVGYRILPSGGLQTTFKKADDKPKVVKSTSTTKGTGKKPQEDVVLSSSRPSTLFKRPDQGTKPTTVDTVIKLAARPIGPFNPFSTIPYHAGRGTFSGLRSGSATGNNAKKRTLDTEAVPAECMDSGPSENKLLNRPRYVRKPFRPDLTLAQTYTPRERESYGNGRLTRDLSVTTANKQSEKHVLDDEQDDSEDDIKPEVP